MSVLIQAVGASVLFMGFGFVGGVLVEHERWVRRLYREATARVKEELKQPPCWHELLGRDIGACMDKVVLAEKCSGIRAVQPASFEVSGTRWKITVERDLDEERSEAA